MKEARKSALEELKRGFEEDRRRLAKMLAKDNVRERKLMRL